VSDPRRALPSVDALLGSAPFAPLADAWPRDRIVGALRAVLEDARRRLANGGDRVPDPHELARRVEARLREEERPTLRPVINATGVVLHTNLGRAPLPDAAVEALARIAAGYSNLEYDLERGARGSRYVHCARLLETLTGAEAALVVNNNAAALLLALNELAAGREVIVSRSELIEIGGSFRIPEILEKSGARLVEVGTTNRTHPEDYERAIGPRTGALLKVHRSNFAQVGFVAEVSVKTLVEIARRHGLPVVHDLGSGLLADLARLGLPAEPRPQESLAAGADVVTFSGDKLLGGPQAGLLVGRRTWIERMKRNPLLRALRVDKLTLAALHATLALYLDEARALDAVPALRAVREPPDRLRARADAFAGRLAQRLGTRARVEVRPDTSEVGGGAYPGTGLPTWVVAVRPTAVSEAVAEARCRTGNPPVVARLGDGALLLDLRTVRPEEEETLLERVADACA
jgi:L-seryl-tRNA(Ser) seleniumtransferase